MRIERLDEVRYEIPREGAMRVPGRVYASKDLLADIQQDQALAQVANVAHLPGIVGRSLAMPDLHWGYGFPIGGVAAFDADEGVISPGGVGYDINCGVRLIRTDIPKIDAKGTLADLARALFAAIPSGVGSTSRRGLDERSLKHVLTGGAKWALGKGFATSDDLAHMEEGGTFDGADPAAVSERAMERGRAQLGTLGSGNHFCEVGYVERVFDDVAARAFGLVEGHLTVMIHSGSRGFGYQVCDDFLRVMLRASADHGIALPDRQLCAAPLRSAPARQYLAAMACAVNYAFANRQLMTHAARGAFERVFGSSWERLGMRLVYDVCHNIAKWETHAVEGRAKRVCVHRKGATRAYPAGHADVPEAYRAVGQPVLVPGDMGRCSYVLVGQETAMAETFGSCCHGAGRVLSRAAAKKAARGRGVVEELAGRGIHIQSASRATVDEEIPEAYKDVSHVVDVVERAGLARKVARLVPLAVVKG